MFRGGLGGEGCQGGGAPWHSGLGGPPLTLSRWSEKKREEGDRVREGSSSNEYGRSRKQKSKEDDVSDLKVAWRESHDPLIHTEELKLDSMSPLLAQGVRLQHPPPRPLARCLLHACLHTVVSEGLWPLWPQQQERLVPSGCDKMRVPLALAGLACDFVLGHLRQQLNANASLCYILY